MAKESKSKAKSKHATAPKRSSKSPRPTCADADIVIRLYDLRREAVMRASRDAIVRWQPESYADLQAISSFGSEHNAAFRQVSSYFEMAFGFARHGAVHPELLAEACGEGVLLYSKVHPYLEQYRADTAPTAFRNAEWIVENTDYGKQRFELFQARRQKALEAKKS